MDVKTFLLIIVGGALANNCVLQQFFGIAPVLSAKGDVKVLAKHGLAVALVALIAALCTTWLNLGAYSTFINALWLFIVAAVIGHFFTDRYLLVALNGVVLGTAATTLGTGFVATLAAAIGAGLGFTVAMLLFAGVESRINDKYVPAAFRGYPVRMLAAGIISMAVICFK